MENVRIAIAAVLKEHKAEDLAKKMGGLNKSTLYKWAETPTENNPHSDIPLARLIQLTLITNRIGPMQAVSEEAGGIFLPGRQLIRGEFKNEHAALRVFKETSDLIQEFTNAMLDGRITRDEMKRIRREGEHLALAAAHIVEHAREVAAHGKGEK